MLVKVMIGILVIVLILYSGFVRELQENEEE